jgi:phosphoglycolate phosphatase
MTPAAAAQAVVRYRERFSTVGIFENRVYDGIPQLLADLKQAGYRLAVATSKPEVYTLRILEHFALLDAFEVVAGCSLEREGETKADMIRLAMQRLGLSVQETASVLMIGDRKHDVLGAQECGIACAGVAYGYAPAGELVRYGADPILAQVSDLRSFLLVSCRERSHAAMKK